MTPDEKIGDSDDGEKKLEFDLFYQILVEKIISQAIVILVLKRSVLKRKLQWQPSKCFEVQSGPNKGIFFC